MAERRVHLAAGDRTVCGRPAGDLPVTQDPAEASCRGCLNPPEAGHGGGESRAAQRRRSRREGMAGVDRREGRRG